MKQIKTISKRLSDVDEFDAAVNEAIAEGWTLTERKVLQPPSQPSDGEYLHVMLYAELERFTEPDECEDAPVRNCTTCKHYETPANHPPCRNCGRHKNWEPNT